MTYLLSTSVIIVAVIVSLIIHNRYLKKISVNYICIVMGMLIALIPTVNQAIETFNADFFMGVIIAPLLFFEGQNTRMNLVGRHLKLIVSLTIGMVILCAIAAGFMTKEILNLSLPLAFILAAISTPTDATATESVTNGLEMPRRENLYLKLESLFNDASGIVLLNMATLWYVNNRIKYGTTIWNFIYSAGGGIIIGGLLAMALVMLRQSMLRSNTNFIHGTYNNGTPLKLVYLLTPYLIYFTAEELGVSGIIAVVFAGLIHNAEGERSSLSNPNLAYDAYHFMMLITDTLNGMVFVILGIMLTRITMDPSISYHGSRTWLWAGIILYLANLLVRYLYVRLIHRLNNRNAWIFSLGGIHGAVTFALAFTVAEMQVSDQDFNLVIMSESILIVLSMLIPTVIFKFILPKQQIDKERIFKLNKIRSLMINAAVQEVQQMDISAELSQSVIFDLRSQEGQTSIKEFWHEWTRMVRHEDFSKEWLEQTLTVFQAAFKAERHYLVEHYQECGLNTDSYHQLYQEIMTAELVVFIQLQP